MRFKQLLVVCAALAIVFVSKSEISLRASTSGLVISQVYGGGGNSGATLKNDFIELFNAGNSSIDLTGMSVQYSSASGTGTWSVTPLTALTLQPGQYYLVQEAAGAGGTVPLPTPDTIGTIGMASGSAKVAVMPTTTAAVGACPAGAIDLVAYGTTNCAEGSFGPGLTNTLADFRANGGCKDTDNNAADFATGAPSPRNSAATFTVCATSTNLGVSASASPTSIPVGGTATLTVNVTPAANPASTGIAVSGDLSSIGGDSNQAFTGSGYSFTYTITVAASAGAKSLPVVATDAQGRSASTSIPLTVTALVPSGAPVVISQIYGGGGNSGATYNHDYVELYGHSTSPVDLTGWSIQYGSPTGTTWQVQALAGTIGPGQYFLIELASNNVDIGLDLPPVNIDGSSGFNMGGTAGKVALVNTVQALSGCPSGDARVVDLVGYGTTANCREGANAPALTNTTAIFRRSGGATDYDQNDLDFFVGVPTPRRTAPFIEVGPSVVTVDPAPGSLIAPRDATMSITFSEPVDVSDPWFHIGCQTSGDHDSATTAVTSQGSVRTITPNAGFTPGEQCTVTLYGNQVADSDTYDSAPGTNNLPADYVWSFTVATGAEPPDTPDVHLAMGNPSGADVSTPDNYLMMKPEYALSYNRSLGRPNWVSWHLTKEWTGTLARNDTFRPDPAIPPDVPWYRVQAFDFSGSGFDRGHMTPNADRDNPSLIPNNQATFLMTNMIAQAPDNNQGPWANFENYLRTLLDVGDEVYIVSGPLGAGGTGSNGYATTLANGHVTVPAYTWKVALVLPSSVGDDVSRIDCTTRTIAVLMPNIQGIRTNDSNDWMNFLTTVDDIQARTTYNFFSNVPEPYQVCIEAGINGNNPALVKGTQTITFPQPADATYGELPFTVTATGGKSGSPVTFSATGACTASGTNGATITPTSAGTCTVTASQAGSVAYEPAPSVTQTLIIHKAHALVSVSGYSGAYDAQSHGASGSAKGVNDEDLASSLSLGMQFTNVPGGTAHWVFSDANYEDQSGDVSVIIVQATPVIGGMTAVTIELGSAAVDVSGIVKYGSLVPTGTVMVTVGTASGQGKVGADGRFTVTVPAAALTTAASPYTVTATYGGEVNFTGATATSTLTVVDTKPPTIADLSATPGTLGPVNHKMIPVTVNYTATDFSGATCGLVVGSNESENALGDGNTSVDWNIIDNHHVQLRSERSGLGSGRIYTITVTCTDAWGNKDDKGTVVTVPK